MKSVANIKSHPIHPMLVSFPIAFFTGTFIMDVIMAITLEKNYGQAAIYLQLGGIIFSFLAAIPGIIDYIYTVPPKSSAKKRANKHLLLNSVLVTIAIIALVLKFITYGTFYLTLLMEGLVLIILMISAWLGGTLVVRNQIGVDHRYANAGRWNETRINSSSKRIELNDLDGLKVNQMRLLHINGHRIVVARTEAIVVAFDDRCTHRGGSLADGVMICETIQCPWHGSQFDVDTGRVKSGPATKDIKTYKIEREGKKYFLNIED